MKKKSFLNNILSSSDTYSIKLKILLIEESALIYSYLHTTVLFGYYNYINVGYKRQFLFSVYFELSMILFLNSFKMEGNKISSPFKCSYHIYCTIYCISLTLQAV
jgi:hypothetical protein